MKKFLFILLAILCVSTESYCQKPKKTVKQVQAEAAKAKKEIERTSKLLKETEKSKSISIERATLLSQQIDERNSYVNSLQQEIELIEQEVFTTNAQIHTMTAKLEELQKDYNQTLFVLYKINSQYEQLIFILSSDDFNQAYNRLKYLQYYSDYMIQQSERIKTLQDSLNVRKYDLEKLLTKKKNLVGEKQSEARKLAQDKYMEEATIKKLNEKQQDLKKKLAEKQALAKKLDKQIEDLIKAEIAAKKAAAAKKTTTTTTKSSTTVNTLTPEEKLVSQNFAENKGRLPWPTATGKITEHFGRHKHPTLEYVEVESNGVSIATTKGSKARAIFDGTVSKIVLIPGRNTAVLIKHGNYYTVYDNLTSVTVKAGQQVKAKQEIGTIYTDPETNSTVLQLQIWKELEKMDPEQWLSK
ncbi:MAG: peptidoglycan DD-metalloendopeptidase family protein [Bacteroidales bacterium]|nr:peptidoglycan DD-metalloendopeptidase family protein [Bacteroidales bacterium]